MKGIIKQIRENKEVKYLPQNDELVKAFNEFIKDLKHCKIFKDGRFQKVQ